MTPLDISLADLIARIDADLPDATDLARISEAHLHAQTLAELADQLVGHYVDQAKRSGASWSEIGQAIGVSKQAAQQRHASGAFERFTDLSRHSIVLAQEAARAHKHAVIGTEHLLLGLLGEPRGAAHSILAAGTSQSVRAVIVERLPPAGKKAPRGHIPFGPDSKQVIEQARRAAMELGHDAVGTEHLLLGVIRVGTSPGAEILRSLGFTADGLMESVRAAATP